MLTHSFEVFILHIILTMQLYKFAETFAEENEVLDLLLPGTRSVSPASVSEVCIIICRRHPADYILLLDGNSKTI